MVTCHSDGAVWHKRLTDPLGVTEQHHTGSHIHKLAMVTYVAVTGVVAK